MIERCVHCDRIIRAVVISPNAWWATPWNHQYSGYNHCDPSPDGNPDRAEPNNQMRMEFLDENQT